MIALKTNTGVIREVFILKSEERFFDLCCVKIPPDVAWKLYICICQTKLALVIRGVEFDRHGHLTHTGRV